MDAKSRLIKTDTLTDSRPNRSLRLARLVHRDDAANGGDGQGAGAGRDAVHPRHLGADLSRADQPAGSDGLRAGGGGALGAGVGAVRGGGLAHSLQRVDWMSP